MLCNFFFIGNVWLFKAFMINTGTTKKKEINNWLTDLTYEQLKSDEKIMLFLSKGHDFYGFNIVFLYNWRGINELWNYFLNSDDSVSLKTVSIVVVRSVFFFLSVSLIETVFHPPLFGSKEKSFFQLRSFKTYFTQAFS